MKINTDGVLLGALVEADQPESILDIGTGTGVIALMLAQRFTSARIDAVEIDQSAAQTAGRNFKNSAFAERLNVFPLAIHDFFNEHPAKKYDLIVSNPPFHINSLGSPRANKTIAKHTGEGFFKELVEGVFSHLSQNGLCWLVLPLQAAGLVKELAIVQGLHLQKTIAIASFADDAPHREIMCFGMNKVELSVNRFVIYNEPKVYTEIYKSLLNEFFTIF
jgi:tRNA1Val (adenine37-N6)-methyltransferase